MILCKGGVEAAWADVGVFTFRQHYELKIMQVGVFVSEQTALGIAMQHKLCICVKHATQIMQMGGCETKWCAHESGKVLATHIKQMGWCLAA